VQIATPLFQPGNWPTTTGRSAGWPCSPGRRVSLASTTRHRRGEQSVQIWTAKVLIGIEPTFTQIGGNARVVDVVAGLLIVTASLEGTALDRRIFAAVRLRRLMLRRAQIGREWCAARHGMPLILTYGWPCTLCRVYASPSASTMSAAGRRCREAEAARRRLRVGRGARVTARHIASFFAEL